jgi:Flp pilus assembly pilin Flp
MRQVISQLWQDDGGAILAIEWLFFATIVLVGLIVGLVALRNAVVAELTAVANAVDGLSVCFSFSGLSNCEASVCGSQVQVQGGQQIMSVKTPADNVSVIVTNPCGDNPCQ